MISILIIGHNNYVFLDKCIGSLIRQSAHIKQIIYIDNNSSDRSVEFIERKYPQVKIIKNQKNLGYAKAANIGIELIDNGFILIMNPDVILEHDYLYNSLKAVKNDDKIAGITGKIYKYNYELDKKTKIIDTVGLVASRCRQFLDNGAGIQDEKQFETPLEVFGISGNCALFRMEALIDSKIGNEIFDEDFYMYKEDVDLCWRLRLLGWKFIYTPTAIAYHNRGTGVLSRVTLKGIVTGRRQLNNFQKYYSFKNHRLMLLKNELLPNFLHDMIYIIMREISSLIWVILFESIRFRVNVALLKQIPKIIHKRKAIMRRKKVNSKEMEFWLRGEKGKKP